MNGDIVIEVDFDMNEEKAVVRTNAKKESLREILGNWLYAQIGQGEDVGPPNEKDEFKIKIKLDLGTDTFTTESDTGNRGLTCGIIKMDVFEKLGEIEVLPL